LLNAPGAAAVVNVHHVVVLAVVVPVALRARTCHSYFVELVRPVSAAVRAVAVLTQVPSQTELTVLSTQYS